MPEFTLIDFLLNLAGLLLWLNSRSRRFDPLVQTTPASLTSALKRAEPLRLRSWHFLLGLIGLLGLRALFYWLIGPAVNWIPHVQLGAIAISFRSDRFELMLLFSVLSFGLTLAVFYLWLLLLSLINGHSADADPVQRLVRWHLGWVDRWPWPVKLVLPLLLAALLWLVLNPVLIQFKLIQPGRSAGYQIEQALVIALGAYLSWKYLIGGLLLLWLISAYVYLGNHAFWKFVSLTGRNLLVPLRWAPLRVGRIDLAPLVAICLVFLTAGFAERGLTALYRRLLL
jgi:uncharacterized protein YggT (Ycf19 family)